MAIFKYTDPFKRRTKPKVPVENKQRDHLTLAQDYEFNRGGRLINMKRAMENRTPPAFVNLYTKRNSKMDRKYW